MYWVTVSIMTAAAMGFISWPLIRDKQSLSRSTRLLWAPLLMVPILALVIGGAFHREDESTAVFSSSIESIAWPGPSMTQQAPEDAATSVAPVSALVAGLRARLAEDPEDVKGWALLAQSHAFMADGSEAEAAIARAVELGFDEADLRHRVEQAFQFSRTTDEGTEPVSIPGIIHGIVKLAPNYEAQLSPTHRLFIFAKATDGSTIPVAVIRRRVNEFPYTFALSNNESMAPGVTLTDFDQVVISARLSVSGTAERGEGDVQSNTQVVRVDSPNWVELIIGS